MFKAVVFVLALLSMPLMSAQAYFGYFRPNAHISVTKYQVTATVVNQSAQTVMCHGHVYGQTWTGLTTWGYMNQVVVYPGQWAHIHAFTNVHDPFVNGWSDLWCRAL